MRLAFPVSKISCMLIAPQFPSLSTSKVFPHSHGVSHWVILSHSSFFLIWEKNVFCNLRSLKITENKTDTGWQDYLPREAGAVNLEQNWNWRVRYSPLCTLHVRPQVHRLSYKGPESKHFRFYEPHAVFLNNPLKMWKPLLAWGPCTNRCWSWPGPQCSVPRPVLDTCRTRGWGSVAVPWDVRAHWSALHSGYHIFRKERKNLYSIALEYRSETNEK